MKFAKRAMFAVALLLAVLGVAPSPAQAATVHGCPNDTVCLYQWVNFGAGRWQSSFYNLSIHTNDCVNLTSPMAYWSNGTKVTDNSGSLVVNGSGAYGPNVYVSVYNWVNCNSGGGISSYSANTVSSEPDLTQVPIGGGLNAYHTITSVKISTSGGPPPAP